jgi:hypothetical protein
MDPVEGVLKTEPETSLITPPTNETTPGNETVIDPTNNATTVETASTDTTKSSYAQ